MELIDKNKYSRFAPTVESETSVSKSSSRSINSVVEVLKDQDVIDSIENVSIRIKFKDNETKILKFSDFCPFLNEKFVPQFTRLIEGYCRLFGKRFSERVLIKF